MDENKKKKKISISIFGAGVAGLSAAHSLSLYDRDHFDITVYEANSIPGGLARSERDLNGVPQEYSWRGFGPWYNNVYKLMKEIPSQLNKDLSVYDLGLSKPIHFKLLTDLNLNNNISSKIKDFVTLGDGLARVWTSDERSKKYYSTINAYEAMLKSGMNPDRAHNLAWIFGPWVGVDESRASMYQIGTFFMRNLLPGHSYDHPLQNFSQKGGSGWLVTNQPINEVWFSPWVDYLKTSCGVKFHFNCKLKELFFNSNDNSISGALINENNNNNNLKFNSDIYLLAIDPFSTQKIIEASSHHLQNDIELSKFKPLIADGPHIQISFQIGFLNIIKMPIAAVVLQDSEFDITLFFENQVWQENKIENERGNNNPLRMGLKLGTNNQLQRITTLWSGTACIADRPGKLYNLPMKKLTRSQFDHEILFQIKNSRALEKLILENNSHLLSASNYFEPIYFQPWPDWKFLSGSNTPENAKEVVTSAKDMHKWINTTRTEMFQPNQRTSIPNLFLAGAHTNTTTGLYSMEAAAESGIKVSKYICDDILDSTDNLHPTAIPQYVHPILRPIRQVDNILFTYNLPQIMTFFYFVLFILFLFGIYFFIQHRKKKTKNKNKIDCGWSK